MRKHKVTAGAAASEAVVKPAEQVSAEQPPADPVPADPVPADPVPADPAPIDAAAEGAGGEDFAVDGRALRVRSISAAGRRRAGFAFGPEPTELAADDLTEDAIAALIADPQLVVVFA